MKIKVCGMKDPDNIKELAQLPIDLMGLIFYPGSPRYVGNLDPKALDVLPESIERVGVFVNEKIDKVNETVIKYKLDYVQLHGDEDVSYCKGIKSICQHIKIIKVFSILGGCNFDKTYLYEDLSDYFLFDTKSTVYGGSGVKFDWSVLSNYEGNMPYFLSGGIAPEDAKSGLKFDNDRIMGLDLNSKFESVPGLKNIALLNQFIKEIKS